MIQCACGNVFELEDGNRPETERTAGGDGWWVCPACNGRNPMPPERVMKRVIAAGGGPIGDLVDVESIYWIMELAQLETVSFPVPATSKQLVFAIVDDGASLVQMVLPGDEDQSED